MNSLEPTLTIISMPFSLVCTRICSLKKSFYKKLPIEFKNIPHEVDLRMTKKVSMYLLHQNSFLCQIHHTFLTASIALAVLGITLAMMARHSVKNCKRLLGKVFKGITLAMMARHSVKNCKRLLGKVFKGITFAMMAKHSVKKC